MRNANPRSRCPKGGPVGDGPVSPGGPAATWAAASLLLAALNLGGCRAPIPFEVQNEPFQGSYQGAFAFVADETNGETGQVVTADLELEVAGETTHLGQGGLQGTLRLDFREEPIHAAGQLRALADNGDEMRFVFEGTAAPTGFLGGIELEGSLQVAGGTGRYRLARGRGELQAFGNLLVGQGTVTAEGVLTF